MNGTNEFGDTLIEDQPANEFGDVQLPDTVVRDVAPGSLEVHHLLPAIRKMGGELAIGEQGDTHPEIISREDIPAEDIDQRGFVGSNGAFYDRETAAKGLQIPTEFEAGRLHSTDLAKAQEQFPSAARIKTPDEVGRIPSGELSTIYGGPRKPVASLAETMVEPVEELTTPRVTTPKFKIEKEDSVPVSVGKEAVNILTSIPEFLSSNLGLMSLVSGAAAPTATAAVFTADMLQSLGNQVLSTYRNWDKMSTAERTAAITDMVGTGVMAGLAAHGTARGIRAKVAPKAEVAPKVEVAPEAPPVEAKPAPVEMKSTEDAQKVGLESKSVQDLERLAEDRRGRISKQNELMEKLRSATDPKEQALLFNELQQLKTQLPREAIETATNSGSAVEGESPTAPSSKLGPRPLDWRQNPEVADWLLKNGQELGIKLPTDLVSSKKPSVGFEGKPMEADAIWKRLEDQHGIKKGGAVELINDPKEAAGVIIPDKDGKPIRIELNQAKLATHGQIDWVLQHEAAHWFDLTNPKVTENILKTVPDAEWDSVFQKVVKLGYSESKIPYEISARSVQKLADAWKGRGWFDKLVGNVQRFAHETLGIKMTRRAAESTSVRAIAQSIKRIGETAATKPDVSAAMAAWRQRTAAPKPVEPAPVAQPELVGAGAALAGEQAPGAQIEQLTQALQNVRESRAPLAEQVKEAFSLGDRLSAAKDTLGRAISGLKATGDLIIKKWQGVPNIDDLLRAKKSLSKAIESRGWRLQQWEKAAYRAVPNPRDQAAIAKWVDAGGDTATLQRGLAEAPAKYKRAYQDALNLSGDKLTAAQNVQNYFESRLQEAIDAGVLDHGVENYLHRIYENKPALLKRALAYTQTGLLNKNPALAKKRFFQFDWEAEKAGFTPVQSFIKRITAYEASLSKAIAAREFIKSASEMKASDGRPIVDIKGVGIPVEDATGARETTLIKPKFNPAKNNEPNLPNGNPNPNYRGDYVNRDYRALSRWKWVGEDAGGKPIFVQGDVAIHPDYVGRVDALLKPSQVRFGKFGRVLRPALAVSSTIKQTMLDLSGFHPVQITVHGLEHRVMPWKIIQDIDLSHPDVDGLLQGGVTLGGDYSGIHREGLVGASLTRKVPWLGPVMESYHQWLFQSYIPRIKMTMALHALERNRTRYAGRLTDEQIFHKTAQEANAAFGELNYTVLERSKTAQDMARLILLAPDFLEARGRFAAQAFQRGGKMFGNEQRTALLLGALTMWVTARIANKIVDDQYHFEPENMFNIVKDGHAYGLRTVQGDILHLLTKPMQFTMSRLNPVYARTILEALTGRDYFGRKRSPAEQVWDAASTTIPISLRSNRERTIWESLANAFGVTARRYSDVDDAFKLAQKWKDTHAIPERGEFIYDPNKDVLRPLKLALNHGDEAGAAVEIKKLVDSKVYNIKKLDEYFKRFASMPFTGSKANDKKFVTSLTEDQRKTVDAARQHKNEIRKLYMKSRSQYLAPASTL